ncbi:hypothetical protein [Saccharothrix australiensis]|uniref:Protein-tyrosine-phosphatase n=1 Tax=Saccharothrix australiensis TaxID=2072 RepID=A0A495VZD5_9PSEU|nr:hypothetical protein [Saccharothrix australiensis]RKT54584.1 protein-tyrosine-phosphatase [Saccharothrix australiensis]
MVSDHGKPQAVMVLAIGYFLWYTPYAALTKALSAGLLPVDAAEAGGVALLPAAAIGTLLGVGAYLAVSGRWRDVPIGRGDWSGGLLFAGFCTAVIMATTTLNFTFAGISVLLMLLVMRGGVLILSPLVDAFRRRPVSRDSWIALALSLIAVCVALGDVNGYHLTLGAVLSVGLYLAGYAGRFEVMSRVAKTDVGTVDRRYFAGEALGAACWQVALCAVLAVAGPLAGGLRAGFGLLFTPTGAVAVVIGLLYAALFTFGTRIYLDPREYTWCVPVNRGASLLAGIVASYLLTALAGPAAPGPAQLVATAMVLLAIAVLAFPARERRVLLFVCGDNTCRSPMASAVARLLLDHDREWAVASAGITAQPGRRLSAQARHALREAGVPVPRHWSRPLTAAMIAAADTVYCMTVGQRDAARAMLPRHADKVVCLDPDRDVLAPTGQAASSYQECLGQLRSAVSLRLRERGCRA